MTSAELSSAILTAIRAAVAEGELVASDTVDPQVRLSRTAHLYTSPVALRLAKGAGQPAPEVAAVIAAHLKKASGIGKVEITGPGFLSIQSDQAEAVTNTTWYEQPEPIGTASWPDRPRTFENPGFRVRYAYSRAACTGRYAIDLGIEAGPGPLDDPREHHLLSLLDELPSRVRTTSQADQEYRPRRDVSESFERILGCVADAYHDVHEQCPALPKGDEPVLPVHAARLMLAAAVREGLGHGLRLLGEIPRERI